MIIPPPQLKLIVDKTAAFVAKNGKSVEQKILAKNKTEESKKKFDFLSDSNPFHSYYLDQVDKIALQIYQQAKGPVLEDEEKVVEGKESAPIKAETQQPAPDVQKQPKLTPFAGLKSTNIAKPLPKDHDFIIKHPNLSDFTTSTQITPKQIEIIKLTAQYAAIIGQKFVDSIGRNEKYNKDFEFLRPGSRFHRFFLDLIDSYVKLIDLNERRRVMDYVSNAFSSNLVILDRCVQRVEIIKKKKQEEIEKSMDDGDQTAFAAIDWHDFVVVETLEFEPSETKPKQQTSTSNQNNKNAVDQEEEDDDMEVEMESDSDMDEDDDDEEPSNLKIVTDYQPKVVSSEDRQKTVILPTGQKIPAQNVNEHVRIDLIDPESREQKKKHLQRKHMTVVASDQVSENLKNFAKNREDVFGKNSDENDEDQPSTKRQRNAS